MTARGDLHGAVRSDRPQRRQVIRIAIHDAPEAFVLDHALPFWSSLTAPEAGRLLERDPVLVLPLAATEQHGPHLPLSTDLDIGLGILEEAFRRLPADLPAYALPPLAVGASLEHVRFPGTISLDASTLAEVIHQQGASLARHGLRRLVLYTSHGGNRHALDAAALRLREERGLLVVKVAHAELPPLPDALPAVEWQHGLHGGAVETAMMLHLRPDLVRGGEMAEGGSLGEELDASLRRVRPEGPAAFAWLAGDLNPQGVVGDPRRGDAALGRRLVEHYGEAIAEVIRDTHDFPLERLREPARE